MLRFDKPKLEGPVAVLAGSAIGGWLGAGTAIGAIGGSLIGGLAASALVGQPKTPSYPTQQMPGSIAATALPQPGELPSTGQAATPTNADVTKGDMATAARRGRLSTILSVNNKASDTTERLGG